MDDISEVVAVVVLRAEFSGSGGEVLVVNVNASA